MFRMSLPDIVLKWMKEQCNFDDWVHPLMMGLEEHLIDMFKHDFEFVDGHQSHLGHTVTKAYDEHETKSDQSNLNSQKASITWTELAKQNLQKYHFL